VSGKERACFNSKNLWDQKGVESNMNWECLAITFQNQTAPKTSGSPNIHFHRKNWFRVITKLRRGSGREVSVSEHQVQEIQVNWLLYNPLRDLAIEKKKEKKMIICPNQFALKSYFI